MKAALETTSGQQVAIYQYDLKAGSAIVHTIKGVSAALPAQRLRGARTEPAQSLHGAWSESARCRHSACQPGGPRSSLAPGLCPCSPSLVCCLALTLVRTVLLASAVLHSSGYRAEPTLSAVPP